MQKDIILYKQVIADNTSKEWFNILLNAIPWHKELKMIKTGIMTIIPRKMAYISDEPYLYRYDKYELPGITWNDCSILLEIKNHVEQITDKKFNSVLLNLYENGNDEIDWHSDKEKQLGLEPFIACLNLGVGRNFSFKNKQNKLETKEYFVESGDVLVMDTQCQRNWLHAILKDANITEPRISLTFRFVYPIDESGITLVNIMSPNRPYYDLYIGRANYDLGLGGSKWANPFKMKNESQREEVLIKYKEHILNTPKLLDSLYELKDLTLGCYCAPDKKCHGNILIELYHQFVLKK